MVAVGPSDAVKAPKVSYLYITKFYKDRFQPDLVVSYKTYKPPPCTQHPNQTLEGWERML